MDALTFILTAPAMMSGWTSERVSHPEPYLRFGRRGGVPEDVREKYARMFPPTATELDRALGGSFALDAIVEDDRLDYLDAPEHLVLIAEEEEVLWGEED